jgi:histidinol-phosphate aminotransferase
VVVDEAYINFSRQKSLVSDLADYPNLVVLQTLSKAWGLAGLRVGMAFASAEIIGYLNNVKPPYNISEPVQELALKALDEIGQVNDMILQLVASRKEMETDLLQAKTVVKVFPSDVVWRSMRQIDALFATSAPILFTSRRFGMNWACVWRKSTQIVTLHAPACASERCTRAMP